MLIALHHLPNSHDACREHGGVPRVADDGPYNGGMDAMCATWSHARSAHAGHARWRLLPLLPRHNVHLPAQQPRQTCLAARRQRQAQAEATRHMDLAASRHMNLCGWGTLPSK